MRSVETSSRFARVAGVIQGQSERESRVRFSVGLRMEGRR